MPKSNDWRVHKLMPPFGPIDPQFKASLAMRERRICLWEYHRLVHNRFERLCLAREYRLDQTVKLLARGS